MDAIAELTHESWAHVWEMNIIEFFNLLAYRKDKREWEKAEMEQWKRTH